MPSPHFCFCRVSANQICKTGTGMCNRYWLQTNKCLKENPNKKSPSILYYYPCMVVTCFMLSYSAVCGCWKVTFLPYTVAWQIWVARVKDFSNSSSHITENIDVSRCEYNSELLLLVCMLVVFSLMCLWIWGCIFELAIPWKDADLPRGLFSLCVAAEHHC